MYRAKLVTDALLANLTAAGLTVGDGAKPPTGAGWSGTPGQSTFIGYVVVHPISGFTDGTLAAADDDAAPLYQISAFGATRAQCEDLADRAHEAVLNTPVVVAGRKVVQVSVDVLGGSRRDDAIQPPQWMSAARYRVSTTP